LRRAEPRNSVCKVSGLDQPPGRRAFEALAHHLVLVREVVERLGLDDSRGDGVDADLPLRKLDGEAAHQGLEGPLRASFRNGAGPSVPTPPAETALTRISCAASSTAR